MQLRANRASVSPLFSMNEPYMYFMHALKKIMLMLMGSWLGAGRHQPHHHSLGLAHATLEGGACWHPAATAARRCCCERSADEATCDERSADEATSDCCCELLALLARWSIPDRHHTAAAPAMCHHSRLGCCLPDGVRPRRAGSRRC